MTWTLLRADLAGRWVRASARRLVGGHEGSGIVEAVGAGVARLKPGDHVVASFVPACGLYAFCAAGRGNLCDEGAEAGTGRMRDGTFRFRRGGEGVPGYTATGTLRGKGRGPGGQLGPGPRGRPIDFAALLSSGC